MEVNTNELPKNSEQWAAIDGYKNYQVSWWGRVRNATTARILKSKLNPNGYMSVNLSKRGSKPKTHFIHQLVARDWAPNPEQKRCVDHIDGSRTNNNWENLRYATSSENGMNAKHRTDGSSVYKGVNYQTQAKKWKAQIGINRQRIYLGIFPSEREAAEAYNARAIEQYGEYAKLNIFED
jgi:hypothetical protein